MISVKMHATGSGLMAKLSVDGNVFFENEVGNKSQVISYEFNDDAESTHIFELRLSGKLPEHTVIDKKGNILEDRRLVIEDVSFDEISLGQLLYDCAEYHHDFNGNGPKIQEKFYGEMGCNGTVKLEFASPIYLWFLENM